MDKTKQEFVVFIHEALADRHSPAHQELYEFLVACFVHADVNKDGKVRNNTCVSQWGTGLSETNNPVIFRLIESLFWEIISCMQTECP